MLGYVKRLLPTPLKRALRGTANALTRGRNNQRHIEQLANQLDELRKRVFELEPEVIHPSEEARRHVADLLGAGGLSADQVNLAVSKHDRMYQHAVQMNQTADAGYVEYMRSGLHMRQVLEAFVGPAFGGFHNVNAFLDFASGYGRLTRFLVPVLDPGRVWVSDIKARAVEFQQQQFGVRGVVSTERPEELAVGERFDCIFVGSLFSHLSETLFGAWLQRLCDLLRPNGLIVFTVHDISLDPTMAPARRGITFYQRSEEPLLHSADKPLDLSRYGTTYVSEAFVRKVVEGLTGEHKHLARYKRGMWNFQDVYVLSNGRGDDLSRVDLPTYGIRK
jgi:SAM-dependent methyltransferase